VATSEETRQPIIQQVYSDVTGLEGALGQCLKLMARLNAQMADAGRSPMFTAAKLTAIETERDRMHGYATKLGDAMPTIKDVAL
jgi:hypothetical protein